MRTAPGVRLGHQGRILFYYNSGAVSINSSSKWCNCEMKFNANYRICVNCFCFFRKVGFQLFKKITVFG